MNMPKENKKHMELAFKNEKKLIEKKYLHIWVLIIYLDLLIKNELTNIEAIIHYIIVHFQGQSCFIIDF